MPKCLYCAVQKTIVVLGFGAIAGISLLASLWSALHHQWWQAAREFVGYPLGLLGVMAVPKLLDAITRALGHE